MALDDADLAQRLDELCDYLQDDRRVYDPVPSDVLRPVRELAEWLREVGPLDPELRQLVAGYARFQRDLLGRGAARDAAERSRRADDDPGCSPLVRGPGDVTVTGDDPAPADAEHLLRDEEDRDPGRATREGCVHADPPPRRIPDDGSGI
jgi:hypothetical protein